METLNAILGENAEYWTTAPAKISVSAGVSGFDSLNGLAGAIESADQAMYSSRQERRTNTKVEPSAVVA